MIYNLPPVEIVLRRLFNVNRARRYNNLFNIISEHRCRRIMEIGTYDGEHATQMIETAKKYFPAHEVEYYGFDLFELFELLDENTRKKETATRRPPSYSIVKQKLEATGARIHLYKGDTKIILPKVIPTLPTMDFVFIDGGHSLETIENDWYHVQRVMGSNTIVVFDDYWKSLNAGCKGLIDGLDRAKFNVEILSPKDRFIKDEGIFEINFVKVKRKLT